MMRRLLLPIFVLALALLPVVLPESAEFYVTLLNYIGLYALVALGLVLLTGVGGLTSFGQAAFVGVGAYATAWLTTAFGWSPWLTLLVAVATTTVVAINVNVGRTGKLVPHATLEPVAAREPPPGPKDS